MCIRPSCKTCRGLTLVEMAVAMGLFSLSAIVLLTLHAFSIRSLAAMANYSSLDQANRKAMDLVTSEIRRAEQVTDYTSNSISITLTNEYGDLNVTYQFDPDTHELIRTDTDGGSRVLLNDCDNLSFNLFQRSPVDGTFDEYPTATNNWRQTVKVVQVTWKTSRELPGLVNSEDVQSARIVIRKQRSN